MSNGNQPAAATAPRPGSSPRLGCQEFLDVVIDPFNARLATPLVPTVRALYADGDTVIAFFDATATAQDGQPYRNTYTWYLRLRDGAIVEATAFFDTIEFNEFWSRVSRSATVQIGRASCRERV